MAERLIFAPGNYRCVAFHACWKHSSNGNLFVKVQMEVTHSIVIKNWLEDFIPEPVDRERSAFVFLDWGEYQRPYTTYVLRWLGWKPPDVEKLGSDVASKCRAFKAYCGHIEDDNGVTRERWRIRLPGRGFRKPEEDDPAALDEAARIFGSVKKHNPESQP